MNKSTAEGSKDPAVPIQKAPNSRAAQQAARLKTALRENLRRRKSQDAARADKDTETKEKK